jgi:hypothetical protein
MFISAIVGNGMLTGWPGVATLLGFWRAIEAWLDRHWPVLCILGYRLSLLLLFGGTALASYHSGLAQATVLACGEACVAMPGAELVIALAAGGAAILAVMLYARLCEAAQHALAPWQPYKPEPAGAVRFVFGVVGAALFVAVAAFEKAHGRSDATAWFPFAFAFVSGAHFSFSVSENSPAAIEFAIGWLWGGEVLLHYFWPQRPGGAGLPVDPSIGASPTAG